MSTSSIITRFAPSPTGFLHVGGARTALFNWAYARHCGGKFVLRIEDTDRVRSTEAAVEAILDGLSWLNLDPDDTPIYQHERAERHIEVAHMLLTRGMAYRCYCTPAEVEAMRETARLQSRPLHYDGRCRERQDHPDLPFVVRFATPRPVTNMNKATNEGTCSTEIIDQVQGRVQIAHDQFDDLILLRSDGSPTYMLSVVVDDHDMGVTDIIRGDDHLTNALRQVQIYQSLDWCLPRFAHVPLIHGSDGTKLSKRHGALSVIAYRDMGILPSAMRNYMARLGWSHGDDEIFSTTQFVSWFDLSALGKSPARFDIEKLTHVNTQHIRKHDQLSDSAVSFVDVIVEHLPAAAAFRSQIEKALIPSIQKIKNFNELIDCLSFIPKSCPLNYTAKARDLLAKSTSHDTLNAVLPVLEAIPANAWEHADKIENILRDFSAKTRIKLGDIAPPARAALTGRTVSIGIFDILTILGRTESLTRLKAACKKQG